MAYVEFYCNPVIGSNLNSGSTTVATPFYVSASGNWNLSTHAFTPTDGSNPVSAGVAVGDFVSISLNSATVTPWVARVTNVVNAVNGTITLTAAGAGIEPATASGSMTLRDGGCWKGPNATVGFPFSLARIGYLLSSDPATNNSVTTRINLKNNGVYSVTAVVAPPSPQPLAVVVEGYSNTPGDGGPNLGGRAVIDGGTVTGTVWQSLNGESFQFRHLEFKTSVTSGAAALVLGAAADLWWDCIVHGSRFHGLVCSGGIAIECEAYDCNKSNTLNGAGFYDGGTGGATFIRCFSHNHSAANGVGFFYYNSDVINCIVSKCGKHGIIFGSFNATVYIRSCDFYDLGGAGIGYVSSGGNGPIVVAENCNFVKCVGGTINLPNAGTTGQWPQGLMFNCGFGTGTMANGTSVLGGIQVYDNFNYPADLNPWVNPDNGNFSLHSSLAMGTGRSRFVATGTPIGVYKGFPEVGAVDFDKGASVGWGDTFDQGDFVVGTPVNEVWTYQAGSVVLSVSSGTLPPGLSVVNPTATTSAIMGTPTTVGTYHFVLRATFQTFFVEFNWSMNIVAGTPGSGPPGSGEGAGGGEEAPPQVEGKPTTTRRARADDPGAITDPSQVTKIVYRDQDITDLVRRAQTASSRQENMRIVGPNVSKTKEGHFMINP